jgi:hypothetical protein
MSHCTVNHHVIEHPPAVVRITTIEMNLKLECEQVGAIRRIVHGWVLHVEASSGNPAAGSKGFPIGRISQDIKRTDHLVRRKRVRGELVVLVASVLPTSLISALSYFDTTSAERPCLTYCLELTIRERYAKRILRGRGWV